MSKRFKTTSSATVILEKEKQKEYKEALEKVIPVLDEHTRYSLRELVRVLEQNNEVVIHRSVKRMTRNEVNRYKQLTAEYIRSRQHLAQTKRKFQGDSYTVEEVAEIFGVTRSAVYKWIQNGKIDYIEPPVVGGKGYLIPKKQFEGKLLDSQKAEQTHRQIFGDDIEIDYTERSDMFHS